MDRNRRNTFCNRIARKRILQEVTMTKGKSKTKYDIVLEIDYFGDGLDVVVRKGGHVYIYPMDGAGAPILDNLLVDGVTLKNKTNMTVYSQKDDYTQEEYDDLNKGDMWGFRWF